MQEVNAWHLYCVLNIIIHQLVFIRHSVTAEYLFNKREYPTPLWSYCEPHY